MPPELTIAQTPLSQGHSSDSPSRPRPLGRARLITAFFFVFALFVPLIGTALRWDPVASQENRILARIPTVPQNFKQVQRFADLFLAFYRDHFGFRNTLIRGLTLARFHGGLALDQNTNIIIGKYGWLFFPSHVPDMEADRNLDPFTPAELDAWQRMLEQRNKFCEDHGFPFIAVIPPDKQSVYMEFVPEEFSRLGPKSRLDQLIDRLHETHSPVHLVDLRAALIEAKKYHRLYFKTDTHWNDYGGFASYPVILAAVNSILPGVKLVPQPASDFIPRSTTHSGDLARYMNLYYEYNEDWPQLVRRTPFPPIVTPENPYIPMTTYGTDPKAPALYMIHDSYTLYLYQFLGPNFSRTCWQWTTILNGPLVVAFKPNVVIDEFLERTMYLPVPEDTADVRAEQPR